MKRQINQLTTNTFDVVIIGGGIFGACAAWDATLRGLKVALIEKSDFCAGVSANSFKIVHGGMRYLQHADFKRLRASCHERSAFLRIAPHLVQPLPIIVPTYGHGKSGKAFLATGLYLYDLLTLDRNWRIPDQKRHIPWTQLLSKSEVLAEFPELDSDGLTGGVVFNDGRMYNPTRLVLSFVHSAYKHGAIVANYVEAKDFVYEADQVVGVRIVDHQTNQELNIKTRTILNAAGPWVEHFYKKMEKIAPPNGTYSRDACFVIRKRLNSPYTIAIQGRTKDPDALLSRPARHLFLSPWRDYTLVGVWHVVTDIHPEDVNVTKQELQEFINEINWAYPSLNLKTDDVLMWNAGLVPFGENQPGEENLSYGKRSHIIDHKIQNGIEGLVSLIGVRYTMGRADAAKAIDLIQRKLNWRVKSSSTDYHPVIGGDISSFEEHVRKVARQLRQQVDEKTSLAIAHNYGTQYANVISTADSDKTLLNSFKNTTVLKAEVIHAIRSEMALKLSDIVFRRTDLATGENPGKNVLLECANLAKQGLGWSKTQTESEINDVLKHFSTF